jgi:choline dehydrogenase-like flavoprotein
MTNTNTINSIKDAADVIVIGTGMAGATIGYALAKAGKKVLFCESGHSQINTSDKFKGNFAESYFDKPAVPQAEHREILLNSGRWADLLKDVSALKSRSFIPYLGTGTGGSSALYGMAMERFSPVDFSPRANYSAQSSANLPENWPISYKDLEPYYAQAEKLFRVKGTTDPLKEYSDSSALMDPPPMSEPSQELFDYFTNKDLHPYRLPLACEFEVGCTGCQGFLCEKNCKNDSAKICLSPAINQYGATLLDNCNVIKLESSGGKVTEVHCEVNGEAHKLTAPLIILAAGALRTPKILFDSKSNDWPNGLANGSGLVGKNLMRHYVDLYAVTTKSKNAVGHMKEIGLNDLYFRDGEKLANIQSFGLLPPAKILVESVEQDVREKVSPIAAFLFKLVKPIPRTVLSILLSKKVILATVMEDVPYLDNKVSVDEATGQLVINYKINEVTNARIAKLRTAMGALLKPYKFMELKQAESNERIAHACGTCRFGDNPAESVLNSVNRAHAISNLYIVDSSFFPSSSGTNPSLTIAANALRVAEHILKNH